MSSIINHPALSAPVRIKRSPLARRMSLKLDSSQRMATLVLPNRVSEKAGLAFLTDHLQWLQDRLKALPEAVPFIPGQMVPLLGTPHLLVTTPTARRGVWVADGVIQVSGPPEFFPRRVADFFKAEAKRQLVARALPMAAKIGRQIDSLRVGDPKSRWGSCNSKGKLAFSWRLLLAPEEVLNYVVAHEVAHLREMNHSPRFWQWVAELHQDSDTPRRWLKANGAALYRYGA